MSQQVTGTICIVSQGQDAVKSTELSFEKGDVLTIVSELLEDGEHYQATAADGSIGTMPASVILKRDPVPMLPMPWFHGAISRFDAEKLLDRNQDGQFLLRTSQNTRGVYALAVSFKGKVNHYLVAMDFKTRQLTINGERYFDSLPIMVESYASNGSDLGTPLLHPVIRRGTLEFYIDSEVLRKTWGLQASELELGDSIGYGEFGGVQASTYRGMQVAVKSIHDDKQSSMAFTSFSREAAIMTHLRHKNLVQLVGVVFSGSGLKSIVMELMGKGSLQKYLISRGRSVITPMELLSFARDVCAGMEYVSSHGFVHRDLAARNVLLNSNGQAKISDFGLSRKADIYVPHEGGKFPIKWTAPEAIKESKFTSKSDVWSFGIFLWELFSFGRTPYPSIPSEEILENLEDGLLMDPPDSCPDSIYDIMCSCWRMEPQERPHFLALQQMLQRSTAESRTPTGSPLPSKKLLQVPDVEDLVTGPVATKAYREAPLTRKATMFLGSIVFIGPHSSGKTSLLRNFTGQSFRLMEPPTEKINIPDHYCQLLDHLDWLPTTSGLVYEDELVRIIVEDLLKHTQAMLKSDAPAPPLPPLRKKRSSSFSESHGTRSYFADSPELTSATNRLSGSFEVIESGSLEGQLQLGIRPHPVAESEKANSLERHSHKKSFLTRLLSTRHHHKSSQDRGTGSAVQRHYSDSVKRGHYTSMNAANGSASPEYYSSLPERLIGKIKAELKECSAGCLSQKYFGKIIDIPGSFPFSAIKPVFITETSVCIMVYDVSQDMYSVPSPGTHRKSPVGMGDGKQNGAQSPKPTPAVGESTYLDQIMSELKNLCLHWSHSNATLPLKGPRIVLVGTHSDKVPASVSMRNFEILRDTIKSSPYEKYVNMMKYIISSSSVIERSNIEDLKRFTMETFKKACRQQVPLRWLRCVRRFQGLSAKGMHFVSVVQAQGIISELCDLSRMEDIQEVVRFLHQNHVVLHLDHIHRLKEIIITSPQWFALRMSEIFAAVSMSFEGALPELAVDQQLLQTRGILSSRLLDYIWRDRDSRLNKDELLTIMHKMDLLCCMGTGARPFSPSATVENFTQSPSAKRKLPPKVNISSVIVPALVKEPMPPNLNSLPTYGVDPLYFRFKDGLLPGGLFPRLLVRCIPSYPINYSLYHDAATFEVDPTSLLVLTAGQDHIRLSLHRIREEMSQNLLSSPIPTNLDDLLRGGSTPNPDLCMAVLMFIQAALSDVIQQWIPHLDYDLCIACNCPAGSSSADKMHYIILSDSDNILHRSTLRCEANSQISTSTAITCWFGELRSPNLTPFSGDDLEFVTDQDIIVVSKRLGASWAELGQILGFSRTELERFSRSRTKAGEQMLMEWMNVHSRNATFFALLGALEIVQRRDIADELIASRMAGDGIVV